MVQLGAGPVEHRHKVVADAPDAGLRQAPDVLAVILDVPVPGGEAQLDVLVDRDALDDLEGQPGLFGECLQLGDALPAPDFAHGHVVHRGDDGLHPGDLADLLQGDFVVFAIPAEG